MNADEIARDVFHTWMRDVAPLAVQMSTTPRHWNPLVHAIATALRAAEARGYERAREQAAMVVMTVCSDAMTRAEEATAIRSMEPET